MRLQARKVCPAPPIGRHPRPFRPRYVLFYWPERLRATPLYAPPHLRTGPSTRKGGQSLISTSSHRIEAPEALTPELTLKGGTRPLLKHPRRRGPQKRRVRRAPSQVSQPWRGLAWGQDGAGEGLKTLSSCAKKHQRRSTPCPQLYNYFT